MHLRIWRRLGALYLSMVLWSLPLSWCWQVGMLLLFSTSVFLKILHHHFGHCSFSSSSFSIFFFPFSQISNVVRVNCWGGYQSIHKMIIKENVTTDLKMKVIFFWRILLYYLLPYWNLVQNPGDFSSPKKSEIWQLENRKKNTFMLPFSINWPEIFITKKKLFQL